MSLGLGSSRKLRSRLALPLSSITMNPGWEVPRGLALHALRTPLSALMLHLEGMAHALAKSPSEDARAMAPRLQKALQQSWRLAAVVDMLFDSAHDPPLTGGEAELNSSSNPPL